MKNDLNKDLFGEFDFMYRHKAVLEEKKKEEEAKLQAERQAEIEAERQKQEEEAAKQPQKPAKTAKKKAQKTAKNGKKTEKTAEKAEKKEPKIHPKYGKPYKNDTEKDRKRLVDGTRRKLREQYKKEKSTNEHEKDRELAAAERAQRRMKLTRFGIYALITIGVAAVFFGVSVGALYFITGYSKKVSHKNIAYQVGEAKNATRVPYATLIRDGEVYVCGNDIVTLCGFTVTGSAEEIKYISPDKGNDTVLFYAGTTTAQVNKTDIRLNSPTYYEDAKLYIPMTFFVDYATGIVCEYEPETEDSRCKITVYKKMLNESAVKLSGAAPVYEPVAFRIKQAKTLEKIDESAIDPSLSDLDYKIDITSYAAYINPAEPYSYITIINESRKATGTYTFDDLTPAPSQTGESAVLLRKNAAKALEALIAEARADGVIGFAVTGGYVTLENSSKDDPTTDERLLGLTVDMAENKSKLNADETRMSEWLTENAAKFGFIIRYPKNKESVTGEKYRPFTLRYVGRYPAIRISTTGLCLEEFADAYNLSKYMSY